MYSAYWGLQRPLFTSAAVRESVLASPVHAEALARLDFLRENRLPFGLLLGPTGSGKSTLLRLCAERAARDGAIVAVSGAAADEGIVVAQVGAGLQIDVEAEALTLWRRIANRLEEIKLGGLTAVVLLDDLDRTSAGVIALVERLIELGGEAITVVATAQLQTARRIGPRLLDLAALRIDLAPWNETETREYLTTSLSKAGRQQPAFEDAAARRLFELSGGAPRKVNQLAQLSLLAGASQKLIQIDAETVEAVQEELSVSR